MRTQLEESMLGEEMVEGLRSIPLYILLKVKHIVPV